ncbi:hypothetical protein CPC08DRAFT_639018, partial [Agrocybe pediades]
FPHREDKLRSYGSYIEGWFTSKHPSLHSKVLLFDVSVRNLVAGGEACLLTDLNRFNQLQNTILVPGGPELYSDHNLPSNAHPQHRPPDICNRFNTVTGCPNSDHDCRYKYLCKACKKPGHNQLHCKA